MVTRSEAEIEQELATLREQHTATLAAIEPVVAELAAAEGPLEDARAVYDTAGRDMLRAQRRHAGPTHDPAAPWRERSSADAELARQEAQVAEVAFRQADAALGRALVKRNGIDQRRSDLTMLARRLEGLIEQAEAELAKARRAADPDVDLLASIRARLFGGAA
jgi:hypothetical protein